MSYVTQIVLSFLGKLDYFNSWFPNYFSNFLTTLTLALIYNLLFVHTAIQIFFQTLGGDGAGLLAKGITSSHHNCFIKTK